MGKNFRILMLLCTIAVVFYISFFLKGSGDNSINIEAVQVYLLDEDAEDDLPEGEEENLQFLVDLTPMLDKPVDFQQNYGEDVIFFTETSSTGRVHVRAVCTLEAASSLNPKTQIFLVFSQQVQVISLTRNPALAELLKRAQNVHMVTVNNHQVIKDTPLEGVFTTELAKSPTPNEHLSDFLRLGLLWKLGGTYMDLDLLTFKSLLPIVRLKNFLTADTEDKINTSMLGFQRNHPFLMFIMETSREQYNPFAYSIVPYSFNVATREYFNMSVGEVLTRGQISDVSFLNKSVISPVVYDESLDLYSGNRKVGLVDKLLENSFGVHMWGSKSSKLKMKLQSKAPYVVLAKKFCPHALKHTPRYF
ncbi:lactosylceramide 4-alpha-galactosyltransferase-like [Neocloeon triangulifer]|uniref:lactosylceramide 4-alpha-galactosyltransferase-like n=1 Tax=Neocloeon triangulifer TaxID=2078957 RepID=UPI00286F21DB|nr:lactosylceramide 4-alpha-galactosyltransferase-like [Neocloeon triangulifer]